MPKISQIWPAKIRFYCGCCITGPIKDLPGMLYIFCCSLGIVIPFCVFVVGQNWSVTPALPIIFLVCVFFMYFFLFMTSCSDPGIIPRKPFLQLHPEKYQKYLIPPSDKQVRLCQTCFIFRPKKTSHCSSCGHCVQIFDHHCGFVGTCIAKRNYRYFIAFITCIFLAMSMFIVNMVVFIIQKSSREVNQTAIIVIVSVVAAVIGIPIVIFLIFHIYVAVSRKTTRQIIKHIENDQNSEVQNQWCNVDPANMDLFEQITDEQARLIQTKLQQMSRPMVLSESKQPAL